MTELFLPGVSVVWDDATLPPEGLLAEELSAIERAVDKRKNEYAAGRRAARAALRACGFDAAVPIVNGKDRAPSWPDGYIGSISHSGRYALAACAKRGPVLGVGIDLEVRRAIESDTWDRILTEPEKVVRQTLPRPDEFSLLVFSAKEAFYKAQYGFTRTFIDFEGAEMTFDDPTATTGRFSVKVLADLPVALPRRCEGRFFVKDDYVLTTFAYAADIDD